jgi:hypothetical protein
MLGFIVWLIIIGLIAGASLTPGAGARPHWHSRHDSARNRRIAGRRFPRLRLVPYDSQKVTRSRRESSVPSSVR